MCERQQSARPSGWRATETRLDQDILDRGSGEVTDDLLERFIVLALFAAAMTCASTPARVETWPERTVRIIVPLPAGLATDLAARLFAERLSTRRGQPVVVENCPGADGIVGGHQLHQCPRRSRTAVLVRRSDLENPLIHDKLPYDPVRDLVPIAAAVDNFFAIAVSTPRGRPLATIHSSRRRGLVPRNSTGRLPQACRNSSSSRYKKRRGSP